MPTRTRMAVAVLLGAIGASANAATLLRGPYIQNNTPSSAMLVWKHVPASDATVEYGTTLAYGSSAPAGSDTLHVVTLGDLAPATRYYYRLLAGSEVLAAGENHWFETSAASGGVRVALFGDSGKGTVTQAQMASRIIRQEVDLILHTGDIVYTSGEELKYNSRFFQPYADLLRHTPIFTTPGNHDLVTHGGLPYYTNFFLPTDRSFDGTEQHYSFDWGDAHFVSVNSTMLTGPVADWVASDLAASDRRWKFVWFHHAVYSCGYHGTNSTVDALLVPVFDAQNVDIVFAGHEHDFQRTYPIRGDLVLAQGDDRNYVNPGGPLYVITGGGAGPRATSNLCTFTNVALSIPHVSRMQIAGDCLYFDAVDSTGAVIDSMSIRKTANPLAPFVQLLRGNGHEQWKHGTQQRVTWLAGGVESTLDLEISRNGGATYTALANGIASSGSHTWTVTGPSASDARLRVVARSQSDGSAVTDVSDAPIVVDAGGESQALPPAVTVAANPTSGEGTFAVTFSGTATALGSATLSGVQWDLGDGTISTENVSVHTYSTAGTYLARFTATDDANRSTTDSVTVTVRSAAAPILATRSPAPDATGVAALTTLVASIVDRGAGVSASGIALRVAGATVTPTVTGTSDSLVVTYTPSGGFTPGDTIAVELDATDGATPPNFATWAWSFIVSSAPVVDVKVNFEPNGFATPAGFTADRGAVYSTSTGLGWDRVTSVEKRGTTLAPELDSYAYVTNSSPATWQMAVPNGGYVVTAVVGSPAYTGLHRVTIENLVAVNNIATSDRQFHTVTDFPVTVGDGFVSVRIGGISGNTKKTKLCWLRVRSAGTSSGGSSGGGTTANQSPSLNVTATPATGTAPLGVLLAANASDADGDAITVTWDFGDGQTGSGANASHTYMAGSYAAIATATDARGATARDTVAIVATAAGGGSTAIARVNFQPSTFVVPSGYSADSGKLFDAVRTYGWSASLKSEAHPYSDPRLASYVYVTNTTAATWDLVVPNGTYAVTVVAGSPAFTGLHRVEVEGTLAIANVATTSGGFITATDIPVVVGDGRLSVRIGGIAGSTKKTKLCYLHVDRPSSKAQDTPWMPGLRLFAEPNPGRRFTQVRLATATATQARIDIFDVRGRRLRALFEGALPAGELGIVWDGRLDSGAMVASGVYYVRAATPLQHLVLKLTLLR